MPIIIIVIIIIIIITRREKHSGFRLFHLTLFKSYWLKDPPPEKKNLDLSWTPQPNPLKLDQCWRHRSESTVQGLSSAFFHGLLLILISEIMARFQRHLAIRNLAFGGQRWHSFDVGEKWRKCFWIYSLRAIERLFPRLSIHLDFWEVWSCWPSSPSGRRWMGPHPILA